MLQIAASRAVYDWGGCHTRSGCGSVMRAEERCVPPQGRTAGSHPFPAFCAEKGGEVPAAVLTETALSFWRLPTQQLAFHLLWQPAGPAIAGNRIYLVIRCLHIPVFPHLGQVNLRFVMV